MASMSYNEASGFDGILDAGVLLEFEYFSSRVASGLDGMLSLLVHSLNGCCMNSFGVLCVLKSAHVQ